MATDEAVLETRIRETIERHFPGRALERLEQQTTGGMKLNYMVKFAGGERVAYRSHKPNGPATHRADVYFGDPISLERELTAMNFLRLTAVPVPEVYAVGEDEVLGGYALLSCLEGVYLRQYLDERGHRLDVFFNALGKIGRTLASTRLVTFPRFGSIQPGGLGSVRPNWADRLADILLRHGSNPHIRPYFTDAEWAELRAYLDAKLDLVRARFIYAVPQIVIYDLHARNFNVHQSGERAGDISGVFDVEFAQAAHPSLEWGAMNAQIFPLYGMKWFHKAKDAFLAGYRAGGGDGTEEPILEDLYFINHAISAVGIYDGRRDGIRDTWSREFARWSLDIARGAYDPAFVVEISRPLHQVPRIE